ncbi:DUF58 domain-containing protein [Falsirhodobacter algicola]|uniref:DUF58 domain-containing protein n=2 Tax=Falsirhodobacter algicola TaxID=2692330 RepID=A0A8J8SM07_9RHOB|nr:DUF58 domain-containing protein [Falsirhodobacter algicola]
MLGEHGRRRAGNGDEFWQYRAAGAGDGSRMIDWRRSARTDGHFVREREWQAAQSVLFWVDRGRSMDFAGGADRPPKGERAQLLALALGVLLLRGGERVGLPGLPARPGRAQVLRLAAALAAEGAEDHAAPDLAQVPMHGRVVLISDFLGSLGPIEGAMARAAARNAPGVLLQVLDPAEESFPFDGRTIFESMAGGTRFETREARGLRDAYLSRLAERKAQLADLARASGWMFRTHHTGEGPQPALLWLYRALERR